MKRKHAVIVDYGFRSQVWLKGLFETVRAVLPITRNLGIIEGLIREDIVVVLEGGSDINPAIYGQKANKHTDHPNDFRDKFEQLVFQMVLKQNAGCIGICRGAQLITALLGGTLIQDVSNHNGYSHNIITSEGKTYSTNSFHHQMMNPFCMPESKFKVLAWAESLSDYYHEETEETTTIPPVEPEVVLYPNQHSLCIQGHPEWMEIHSMGVKYYQELVNSYITNC